MQTQASFHLGPVSAALQGALYEQLIANVKREIIDARLADSAALPSTRSLAAELRISVITVARAYEELEREGLVYSRQGQGTFVAEQASHILKMQREAPWTALLAAVEAGRKARLSDEQMVRLLHLALRQGTAK